MITKTTTKLFALLSLIMLFTNLSAQHTASDTAIMRKQRCDTLMKHTTYIFEGKLIASKEFKGTKGMYYYSNIFEVNEVISGSLQKGTVEVISDAPYRNAAGNKMQGRDKYSSIHNGTTINFCQVAEAEASNSGAINANSKSLRIVDATVFSGNKISNHSPYSTFNYFSTVSQFYTYLSSNYGIKIDNTLLEKKSPVNNNVVLLKEQEEKRKNFVKGIELRRAKTLNERTKQNTNPISDCGGCKDLFISEVLSCGTDSLTFSNNIAVELYNASNTAKNLANYSLRIYHNGSTSHSTITFTGNIAPYATFVVANPSANSYILAHSNITSTNMVLNGNEIIVLEKTGAALDQVGGNIGTNAPTGWAISGGGNTVNSDIRRKQTVNAATTNWNTGKTQWTVLPSDSIHNLNEYINNCGVVIPPTDPDLNLTLTNPQINGNTFQFDITATSTGLPTYLDYATIYLSYNSAIFGTHAVLYNRVSAVLSTSFSTFSGYLDPQTTLTDGQDTIGVIFGTNDTAGSWSRTQITNSPVVLMTITIQLENCGGPVNVQFIDTTNSAPFTWYVSNATDDPNTTTTFNYTNVTYAGGSILTTSIPPCNIIINDFPSPVLAGVGQTITIIGSGFGTSRGSGQVKFTNADWGGTSYLPSLNAKDYVISSWTDTQIQIILPSYVDSLSTGNPDTTSTIGGGNFMVTNNSGQTATSGANLAGNQFSIVFSLLEARNPTFNNKNRVNLRQQDTSGGYVFRLNPTTFPVGSNARICFTKAVQDWRCITGANLTIGKDTVITGTPIIEDGVSYVFWAPSTDFLAFTQPFVEYCSTDITSLKEADIQFSTSWYWDADTNKLDNLSFNDYDFYSVCLHEIGHVVGLEHNVVPTDLMYYKEMSGSSSVRKFLNAGTSPAQGGVYNVNHSISTLSIAGNCWTAMVLGSCLRPTGINQYTNNSSQLLLYPNPSNDNVTIQSSINSELGAVIIYNMLGEIVYSQTTKENNTQIDVSQQSAGVYLIKVQNQIIKLIKN